ncbi:MAG: hypothetical protein JWP12_3160 [Bacteroidetes bacterium]|nr:hypothetical protein [Bacteroidota bacterium]
MLRILKFGSILCMVVLATSCKREGYVQLRNGLYELTDSISGKRVAPFKTFDYGETEFVDTACILSLQNVEMAMDYDSMMYADTFAVIRIKLNEANKNTWKQKTAGAQRKKIALILNSQFIQWMVIPDTYVPPVFTLCYCDYNKAELKKIEELLPGSPPSIK